MKAMSKWVYDPCLCRSEGYTCESGEKCAQRDAAIRAQREAAEDEFSELGHWVVPKLGIAVGLVLICLIAAGMLQ
jgi:hypothetical protein